MRNLIKRLEALEAGSAIAAFSNDPVHWIVGALGQSPADALAEYETQQGPVGRGPNVVVWEIIDHLQEPACAH